jgi:hypothetical protein
MPITKIRAGAITEDTLEDKDGDTKVEVEQNPNENKIRFSTNGSERAIIDDYGNVGIGTETPSEKLTINGVEGQSDETFIRFTEDDSDRALIGINSSNNILIENLYSNKHIVFKASDAGTSREGLRLDGAVPEVVVNQTSDSLVNFRVESDNNTHMLYVDGANDKVGIGTSTPTDVLHVEGTSKFQGNIAVNQKAISLDGVDDRIVVGDYDAFTFSDANGDLPFSISAWIYVNDVSTDIGTIVGKFTATAEGNEWMFKQEQGYLHFYMYDFSKSGTGDQKRIIASSATITSNTWHHVVVTCDGGSAAPGYTLYTDGSTTAGTAIFTNDYEQTRNTNAPLTIGAADLATGNRIFEDKIADVAIFNRELSSAEVTELYNNGNVKDVRTHSAYSNVISWWKMGDDLDSTSTDGIIDYVSGYHGTIENGASIVSETTLGSDNVGPISITISGSLGVGTENPESTLHVAGRTKADGDLIVSANAMVGGSAIVNRDLTINGSIGIGTTEPGEALDVAGRIAIQVTSDPSTVTNYAHIYSKDVSNFAEVFVRDEAGNVTQISPHNEEGEWQYFSRNVITGKVVKINMEKMIRRLEEITGESFMEEWYEDPTT